MLSTSLWRAGVMARLQAAYSLRETDGRTEQGKHGGVSEQWHLHQTSEVWEGFLEEKWCAWRGRHG